MPNQHHFPRHSPPLPSRTPAPLDLEWERMEKMVICVLRSNNKLVKLVNDGGLWTQNQQLSQFNPLNTFLECRAGTLAFKLGDVVTWWLSWWLCNLLVHHLNNISLRSFLFPVQVLQVWLVDWLLRVLSSFFSLCWRVSSTTEWGA